MKKLLISKNGMTLIVAIIFIAIVFLFTITVLTLNDNLTRNVSFKVGKEDALQIAEAGYNHYMYYLNQDSSFFQSPDGIHIPDDSGELGFVPETFDSNGLPLSYKTTTYKSGNKVLGYYKIKIVQPMVNQYLTVYSTGWTADNPDIKRTVKVQIHKRTFSEHVEFWDDSGEVYWTTGDKADGPVFCNKDILIDGNPEFLDDVFVNGDIIIEKGRPKFSGNVVVGGRIIRKNGATYEINGSLTENKKTIMAFPISNNDIIEWGESDKGLSFEGRTCILLQGKKMKIRNKSKGDVEETYDLPSSGVLLVKNGTGNNQGNVFISGTIDGKLTVYAQGNVYLTGKDPTVFTHTNASVTGGIFYSDTRIPSKTSTGSNFSDDMLGIISEKDIIVATRTWPSSSESSGLSTSSNRDVSTNNITVYAALMTKNAGRQIFVEDFRNIPAKEDFKVVGSKIQNAERGAVGTFDSKTGKIVSGYNKINQFDFRLKTMSPPHFIEPDKSGWEVRSWEEVVISD